MTAYTSHVTSKQPGYWRLELRPVKAPPLPSVERQRTAVDPWEQKKKDALAPLSIQQFMRVGGGLNPDYNRGQWAGELRMVRDSGKHGLMPGVLNRKAHLTFEEMAEACRHAGYIAEADIDMMLWALSKDIEATLVGEKRNRVYGHSGVDYVVALEEERWEAALPEEAAA